MTQNFTIDVGPENQSFAKFDGVGIYHNTKKAFDSCISFELKNEIGSLVGLNGQKESFRSSSGYLCYPKC